MEENDKIKEAMEELEKISQDESLRRIAELKEKYIRDESSARRYYKEQGLAEGRAEGLEQGRQEGIELGKQEGLELGKQEGIELGKQEGLELGKQQGLKLGKAEGRAEGELKQKKKIITNMLKNGIFSITREDRKLKLFA